MKFTNFGIIFLDSGCNIIHFYAQTMTTKITVPFEVSFFLDHSLSQAQDLRQRGVISDRVYGHYCFLWLWSAPRFDYRHEEFYRKFGKERYWRRISRVKTLVEELKKLNAFVDYKVVPLAIGRLSR